MPDPVQDFLTHFHNLGGETISQRKKEFFKLLKRRCLFENEEQLNMALNKMQPTNYLESLFYIDALIYFKKTTELLEIFKQGNEVFISKIIKQPWFFKEVFKGVTIEEVVNEFLPCTSFAIRMKVLKKLSITLDENQMDQLFDCVLKRYGLYIASNIVHACSPTKISEVLSNNKIFLRPSQLKYIVNKNSGIFKYYIEYYKTHTNSCYDDENVINYIAIKYPQLMLDLKKDEKLHVSVLGHRTSKRIVDLVKDDIIKDVRKYLKFLKNDVIVRKLGNNFESIYLDLFPKNEKEMNSYDWSNKVLKFYPRRRQWDLLAKTFSHVFNNRNLLENVNLLDYDLIKVCPDKNIIHKWAEIKYKEQETDSFLKYFEPSKAITIIKEKINVTSASNSRGNLLELMIDVCEQNDIHFLETVLCYVCFRHRNEEVYIRRSFLNHINFVYKNKMGTFTEKIWQCIYEQLDLLRLTNKYCDIYADYRDFLKKYFEFLIEKSKPIGEFENFIERCITLKRSFLLGLKNPPIEKKFLVKLIELIPNCLDKKNEEKYQFTCKQLIQDLTCFSRDNKDYYIDLSQYSFLLDYIKVLLNKTENLDDDDCIALNSLVCFNHTFPEILKMNDAEMLKILLNIAEVNPYILTDIAKQMVTKNVRSNLENEMLQLYFHKLIDEKPVHAIHQWFIKNEPRIILSHIDKIVINSLSLSCSKYGKNHVSYLKEIKLYSHLNLDAKFIEYYKMQLRESESKEKEHIIELLSLLDSTEGLATFVEENLLPKKEKLNILDEAKVKQEYILQCKTAKVLRNVVEPLKMLPTVIKFCVGDYLKSALPSLYSIFYRCPENQLYFYVDILSKRAVSVKKHAIFLSCEVLNCEFALQVLKATKETNISSQKHLFSSALKYFLKNHSQELFDTILSNMHTIDKNDNEALCNLISAEVPNKYKIVYLEKCWQFFEDLRKKEISVKKYLDLILNRIDSKSIPLLSPEFCKNVITLYFKQRTDVLCNIDIFTCNVLRYREAEQIENFNFVFEILCTFKNQNNMACIKSFFDELYYVASEEININFIKLCNDYWLQLFTPIEMFYEFIVLKLLHLKVGSSEPFIENYAKNTALFIEQIISEYGLLVYSKFLDSFNKAHAHWKMKDKLLFVYYMLKFKVTPFNCLIGLNVVNRVSIEHLDEEKNVFHDVVTILKDVDHPVVKIYYNSFAINM